MRKVDIMINWYTFYDEDNYLVTAYEVTCECGEKWTIYSYDGIDYADLICENCHTDNTYAYIKNNAN